MGVLSAASWISLLAIEIVNILVAVGISLDISSEILGTFVLAFGNNVTFFFFSPTTGDSYWDHMLQQRIGCAEYALSITHLARSVSIASPNYK